MEFVVFGVQGSEKRNALDVIPVVMGDEDMSARVGAAGGRGGPAVAEDAKSGAAIEDELIAVGRGELETRSVTTVAPSGRVYRGRGAANSPEAEFGDGVTLVVSGTAHGRLVFSGRSRS